MPQPGQPEPSGPDLNALREASRRKQISRERRGEIALAIVEQLIVERGIPGAEQFNRDVGNEAKKLGIDKAELVAFYRQCAPLVLGRVFGFKKVSVSMTDERGTETIAIEDDTGR